MTRKQMAKEMLALSNLMGKTKNCTKTEWERTNKKQYAKYKAEHDRLRAEYDRKYRGDTSSERSEKPRKTASKRSTSTPTYTVWDSKRGKTFATAGEASAYAEEYRKKTGEILAITQTKRKATHEYGKRGKK